MIIAITHVFNNILEKTHIGTGSLYQYFGGYTNVRLHLIKKRYAHRINKLQTMFISL